MKFFSRFSTLRWRLTLFYTALLAVLLLGMGIFISNRLDEFLTGGVLNSLKEYPLPGIPIGLDNPTQDVLKQYSSILNFNNSSEISRAILDSQGNLVTPDSNFLPINPAGQPYRTEPYFTVPLPSAADLAQAAQKGEYFYFAQLTVKATDTTAAGQEPGLIYIKLLPAPPEIRLTPQGTPNGYILQARSLKDARAVSGQMQLVVLATSLIVLIVAVLVGLPIARLGLRPLNKITRIARETRSSDLSQRVSLGNKPRANNDEVWQLAQEFNAMLDKIETAFKAQQQSEARTRQFVADASHELRSPLTVLGGYLDVMLMGAKDDPVKQERILNSMRGEVTRLSRLVIDLLTLTRFDAKGATVLKLAPVKLVELLERSQNNFVVLAGNRKLNLEIEPEASTAVITADPDQLYQVIANLLDNAIRYSDPTGHITLRLSCGKQLSTDTPSAKWAVISVQDDGCGISPEQLAHIFDRFYRADQSRTRHTGNAGLGLAISKSIVEAHGGTLQVESQPEHGSIFSIYLPTK